MIEEEKLSIDFLDDVGQIWLEIIEMVIKRDRGR
jgi:hypothetical protein